MIALGSVLGVALVLGLAIGATASLRTAWWTIASVVLMAVVVTAYEIDRCGQSSMRCEAPVLTPVALVAALVVFLGIGVGRALRRRE